MEITNMTKKIGNNKNNKITRKCMKQTTNIYIIIKCEIFICSMYFLLNKKNIY